MFLLNVNHRPARLIILSSSCCPYVNQDITKQVRSYKNRYIKIDKPPTCKLDEGTYRLVSEPEGEIKPEVRETIFMVRSMF